MSKIEWNNSFELGFKKIDDHHKHLIELINRSHDPIAANENGNFLCTILDEIFEYARYHFAAEEYWMRVNKYPKRALHVNEHDIFSKKVSEFKTEFCKGSTNKIVEAKQYITIWITDHILQSDSDFVKYTMENTEA